MLVRTVMKVITAMDGDESNGNDDDDCNDNGDSDGCEDNHNIDDNNSNGM